MTKIIDSDKLISVISIISPIKPDFFKEEKSSGDASISKKVKKNWDSGHRADKV